MKILHSEEAIEKRASEIATEIGKDYAGHHPIMMEVLNGARPFMRSLVSRLEVPIDLDHVKVRSYHGSSSGELILQQEPTLPVEGRRVILVEDILDTGKTLKFLCELLRQRGAAHVEIATLILKARAQVVEVQTPRYVGFEYDGKPFLIGFGLDYNGYYRDLPDIRQMTADKDYHPEKNGYKQTA